jgi:leucyl aminopeptidase
MDIQLLASPLTESDADALLLFLTEDSDLEGAAAEVNAALSGALADLRTLGDFTGKTGDAAVLYTRGALKAGRVIVVGLGKAESLLPDTLRRAGALGVQKARSLKAGRVAAALPSYLSGVSVGALAEGALLGLYTYTAQKSAPTPNDFPQTLDIHTSASDAEANLKIAQAIAAGVFTARDLVNAPPNVCTPDYMAQTAREAAEATGMKFEALDRAAMADLKMGALLGVAQGSDTPPRFIILEHNSDRADLPTVVLVGKGVTFDTGGYSIKTQDGMVTMKGDMAGGAAVIGAMRTVAELGVPLRVIGLVPAADNMISGGAYRPQDVLTASNGVTIEVISTDAEGRLLLADALVYAARYNPAAVVDIATLTGAAVIALGALAGGLFVTDDGLRDKLLAAGSTSGERLWPLPLYPEFDKMIESDTADIKNSGGRYGGASVGAIFLKHFVSYPAWAHIDMAGLGLEGKDNPYVPPKGATGYGVRLLVEFVRSFV